MPPSVGRIVHFRLPDRYEGVERWRPALITAVEISEIETQPPSRYCLASMVVTLDGPNDSDLYSRDPDKPPIHTIWRGNITEGTGVGHWRWPPKV